MIFKLRLGGEEILQSLMLSIQQYVWDCQLKLVTCAGSKTFPAETYQE